MAPISEAEDLREMLSGLEGLAETIGWSSPPYLALVARTPDGGLGGMDVPGFDIGMRIYHEPVGAIRSLIYAFRESLGKSHCPSIPDNFLGAFLITEAWWLDFSMSAVPQLDSSGLGELIEELTGGVPPCQHPDRVEARIVYMTCADGSSVVRTRCRGKEAEWAEHPEDLLGGVTESMLDLVMVLKQAKEAQK